MIDEHKYTRDKNNPGAIINTDKNALNAYKIRKQQNYRSQMLEDDVKNLSSEVQDLKDSINDIKELLIKLND